MSATMTHPTDPPVRDDLLWPAEAAKYLRLDKTGLLRPERSIYRMAKAKQLPFVVLAGRMAFLRQDLDNFLAKRQNAPRGRPRKAV
jgi:hypothetical protein